MPMPTNVFSHVESAKLDYKHLVHRVVYTAYDAAQTLRVKVGDIAKPLVLKVDKGWFCAVLSAGHMLDLKKVTKLLKAKRVRIPTEKEVIAALKLKKKQGLSPFGSLYKIPVLLDKAFAKNAKGIFPTGSFTDSLLLKLKDFVRLESPLIGAFAAVKKFKKPKSAKKKKSIGAKKNTPAKKTSKRKPVKKK
ncbi:YbaK/EbsC family protein [Candidatus Uhrbacteria bacterium]|nr:YbaK/EbsC family protein [Candidatus Uhrbacteria bacterium]